MHDVVVKPGEEVVISVPDGRISARRLIKLILDLTYIRLHFAHLLHLLIDKAYIAVDTLHGGDELIGV